MKCPAHLGLVPSHILLVVSAIAAASALAVRPLSAQNDLALEAQTAPPMVLQWKFTPGEVIAWDVQIDETVIDDQEHAVHNQRCYGYEWEVTSVDERGLATIEVRFNRVQDRNAWLSHEFDSLKDSPFVADEKRGRLRMLDYQCRAMLNARFTALINPRGGVQQIIGAESVLGPAQFTPGDMPALPADPVRIGDEWKVPVGSHVDVIEQHGVATQRLTAVEQDHGRTILLIEATNQTLTFAGMPDETQVEPMVSKSRFDLQAGKMIDEEISSRVRTEISPGKMITLEQHITRRIVPSEPRAAESARPGTFIFGSEEGIVQPLVIGGRRVRMTEREVTRLLEIDFFHTWDQEVVGKVPNPDQLIGVNTRFDVDDEVGIAVYAMNLEGSTFNLRLLAPDGEQLVDQDLAINLRSLFASRRLKIPDPGVYFFEFTMDGAHLFRVPVQISPAREIVVDQQTQANLFVDLDANEPIVVVCQESAKIYGDEPNTVTNVVHLGDVLQVVDRSDTRLKVSLGAESGWIDRSAVLSLKDSHAFFTQAIAQNPTEAANYYGRGRVGLWIAVMLPPETLDEEDAQTLKQAVLQDLNAAIRLDAGQVVYYATRARYWIAMNLHEKAIADLKEAVNLDPSDSELYAMRGTAYLNLANFDQAAMDFNAAIHRDPERAMNYLFLGTVQRMKGDYARAVISLTKAIERDPTLVDAYRERGLSHYFAGELDEALADVSLAIEHVQTDAQLYLLRGSVWNGKQEYDAAIKDFSRAIELNAELADAWTYRGYAWLKKGDAKQAERDFERAIEVDPSNVYALLNHAGFWGRRGFYATPIADIEKVLTIEPNRPDALNKLAEIFAACPNQKFRDGSRAVELATKACQLTEYRNPEYLATLAAAHAESGNYELAIHWQQRAIQLVPAEAQSDANQRLELYQSHQPYRLEQSVGLE